MITKKTAQLIAAIGTMAMIAYCLFGCSSSPETVTISLPSNATTGYVWRYSMSASDVLREVGSDYAVSSSKPGMVGVGGTQTYTFAAAGDGTVTIDFIYGRPWEDEGATPDASYTYTVSRGHITLVGQN